MCGVSKKFVFAQSSKANTFIGGLANDIDYNTKEALASKLGLVSTRISSFRRVGENIECRIEGAYTIPTNCFGNSNHSLSNQNITYYYDFDGLVDNIWYYAFRGCTKFVDFKFSSNLKAISNTAFAYTSIVHADLSYLNQVIGGEANWFQGCSKLLTANLGLYNKSGSGTYTSYGGMFQSTPLLQSVVLTSPIYLDGTFRDSGLSYFESDTVLELRGNCFLGSSKIETLLLSNCQRITGGNVFYRGSTSTLFKTLIAPKIFEIGVGASYTFARNAGLELVDIRACKTLGTNIFYLAFKSGGILKVHEFMATSNAGAADANLTYVKGRGVTVEFYDDNGNYVSTL
jgi:hypothetical protein